MMRMTTDSGLLSGMTSFAAPRPLAGRVAVITGASSVIGEHAARKLAGLGADVALLARGKDRLQALAADLTASGSTALVLPVDLTEAEAVTDAARRVQSELGPAGIVLNQVGIIGPAPGGERAADAWPQQIDRNLAAAMTVIRSFTAQLVQSAAGTGQADLISVCSVAARSSRPDLAVYAATTAYLLHLTGQLRRELGPQGVRVATVETAVLGTGRQSQDDEPGSPPAGREEPADWLPAEDVAQVIAFTLALPAHLTLRQISPVPTRTPFRPGRRA
jgi:NADP-dependent 3-hydroxy acid dehydrogenase YdfG